MARVFVNDSTLSDIADAIREKNGTEDTYKPSQMADAVRGIQSGGSDIDADGYYVARYKYASICQHDGKRLEFPSKMRIFVSYLSSFTSLFADSKTLEEVEINHDGTINLTTIYRCFYAPNNNFTNLKKIVFNADTSKVTNFSQAFSHFDCSDGVEIIGELDFSSATTAGQVFQSSRGLKEVRFAKETLSVSISLQYCNNLSDESIQSIIDGLATVETSQTITFHADVKAKLTEEQIATITSKNWTLA